jgi:hypothetical protein
MPPKRIKNTPKKVNSSIRKVDRMTLDKKQKQTYTVIRIVRPEGVDKGIPMRDIPEVQRQIRNLEANGYETHGLATRLSIVMRKKDSGSMVPPVHDPRSAAVPSPPEFNMFGMGDMLGELEAIIGSTVGTPVSRPPPNVSLYTNVFDVNDLVAQLNDIEKDMDRAKGRKRKSKGKPKRKSKGTRKKRMTRKGRR